MVLLFYSGDEQIGGRTEAHPQNVIAGHFIIYALQEPSGVFYVSEVKQKSGVATLNKIDCPPDHWQLDTAHGPDTSCRQKDCPHIAKCPIMNYL